MSNCNVDKIVDEVVKRVREKLLISVEASGRHVHLSKETIEVLFGKDYELKKAKDLSQPGQYVCEEKVTLIGPKGTIKNVAILGPTRNSTQVEISKTDALILGVKPPVRESGSLEGSASITLAAEATLINIDECVIVAKRHIHVSPDYAELFKIKDKDRVNVEILGDRPLIFKDVVIRVSSDFKTFMHIDYDEANACGYSKGTKARIIK